MSYVFDPTTGLVQWVSNLSINPYPHDAPHGIYGGTYGSNEEYEVLRQQTAEQRDFSGYTYGPHSPAGTRSHRVSDFDHSSASRRFPARIGSLSGSPQLRNSQRNTTTPDRQNEHSNSNHSMGGHDHPGRGNSVPHRYHDGLRSKEDLIEELVARIGPAGYVHLIVARDNIRLYGEPMRSDEELLAEELADLDRKAYSRRTTSRDGLRPLSMSQSPTVGPARFSEEIDCYNNTSSRKLIQSLDEHYRHELKQDYGHRFDNVDDTVVAAYVNACDNMSHPGQRMQRIIGRNQPFSFVGLWVVPIPFLGLRNSALEVMLPLDQEAITELNNDVLRVLYVHLSNDSRGIPSAVTPAVMDESRRRVLNELVRRGFAGESPKVVRLRGLNDYSVPRRLSDPRWLHGPVSGSSALVDSISGGVERLAPAELRTAKGRRDNKARRDVHQGSTSMTENLFGEVSEKKKGKAPVARVYEVDSSDHSSAASSSSTVQYELEVSSSEDSTPPAKGKVPAAEATSHGDSYDRSKTTKHKANKTPAKNRSSVSD